MLRYEGGGGPVFVGTFHFYNDVGRYDVVGAVLDLGGGWRYRGASAELTWALGLSGFIGGDSDGGGGGGVGPVGPTARY